MFDTSSEQPSASSVIVVSNSSSYHTSGTDVINAAFTEAFGSVCDASYYFKNLIDFHQSHFHHLHKHHVFNLNLNVKTTSADTSSDEANPPLTNTTNLSRTAKKKRKHDSTEPPIKPHKTQDTLVSLKLDSATLDENLNVKTSRAQRSAPCTFAVNKLIFKKYRRLRWGRRRPRAPPTAKRRPTRFRRLRRTCRLAEAPAQPQPTQPDSYLAYQSTAGYYYSSDADLTRSQFYEDQNTSYQPGPARALNHDLLKLSYDKFKQFRLNEKLLQQTVLIRNAIKLLQYELQYQHEQEIQQQYLYQQQQHHPQQHVVLDYTQSSYQQPLMQMNASVYESVDEVMSRSAEPAGHVQTTSYFVNDVNRSSGADEDEEEEEDEEESRQTDNDHNTQTVNESSESGFF